ncbi:hypothetical protein C0991_005364 [Blastosporella zonata]|nr:hypothetical protein C0991_005364 [Blastosporella zonata]
MVGAFEGPGPQYISAHSADLILSDIRPIKLKIEALQAINVLLDEFLFNILKTSDSLSTDNMRSSLLSLLPTTLGKEALLEAEVELRAYWDRTAAPDAGILDDGSNVFHLQWAFELLRLKCEAYSTFNESDEDQAAESRTNDRMSAAGGIPPKAGLLAPASLYLTAILEALCEHVLSNVGRVVARDSSRTNATVHDLFIALCEDHTIYDLFKKMRVYEQIEQLSKTPKVRRSKSLTRNDKSSRTSSPHPDMSPAKDPSGRFSEAPAMATNTPLAAGNHGARSSFEKTRAMKMFKANNRSSIDGDSSNGHKRSNSVASEKSSRHTATLVDGLSAYEDDALQQEFDDLMRSSATMKVSLTPDRLKTMEVYKQEKERGNRRPPPIFKPESDAPQPLPPRATGRHPSIYRVDSIKEDDEEGLPKPSSPLPTTRNRQASVSAPPTTSPPPSRVRSLSTSGPSPPSHSLITMQNRRLVNKVQDPSFPPRTRRVQRNRESLDLDDVMGGSDNDDGSAPALTSVSPVKSAALKRNGPHVSANTRDLIDFLSQGPPPDMGGSSADIGDVPVQNGNGKPKGTGRLQRMISKLSLSNGDRSRGTEDVSKPPLQVARPLPTTKPSLNNLTTVNTLSSLANRPIPPRPPPAPRPISPPASIQDSSEEHSYAGTGSRSASLVQRRSPLETSNRTLVPVPAVPTVPTVPVPREHSASVSSTRWANGHTHQVVNGNAQSIHANGHIQVPHRQYSLENHPPMAASSRPVGEQTSDIPPSSYVAPPSFSKLRPHVTSPTPPTSPARKPPPVYTEPTTEPHLSREDAHHMHRLFSRAATADECRLILDMFLAKAGIPLDSGKSDAPSPSPSAIARKSAATVDTGLEATLLELFLGDGSVVESISFQKNLQSFETVPADPESPHPNGNFQDENADTATANEEHEEALEGLPINLRGDAPSVHGTPVEV